MDSIIVSSSSSSAVKRKSDTSSSVSNKKHKTIRWSKSKGTIVYYKHDDFIWMRSKVIQCNKNEITVLVDSCGCKCIIPFANINEVVSPANTFVEPMPRMFGQNNDNRFNVKCPRELERRSGWIVGSKVRILFWSRIQGFAAMYDGKWMDNYTITKVTGDIISVRGKDYYVPDGREILYQFSRWCSRLSTSLLIPGPAIPIQIPLTYQFGQEDFKYIHVDEETLKDFECCICQELYKSPVQHSLCSNLFCKSCLLVHSPQLNRPCPICRIVLTSGTVIEPAKLVMKLINNFQVQCNRCATETTLEKLQTHWDYQCPQKCRHHACPHSEPITGLKQLMLHENKECQNSMVRCDKRGFGCSWYGKLGEKSTHRTECLYIKYQDLKTSIRAEHNDHLKTLDDLKHEYEQRVEQLNHAHVVQQSAYKNQASTVVSELQKLSRETYNSLFVTVGAKIDCRDVQNFWYQAQVLSINNGVVGVKFIDFHDKFTEYIPIESHAFAPWRIHTRGNKQFQTSYYRNQSGFKVCACNGALFCFGASPTSAPTAIINRTTQSQAQALQQA
jgi:hypothetical protein